MGKTFIYPKVGEVALALDYKEPVLVVKVERRPNHARGFAGTYTIKRSNGADTENYPGYLLCVPKNG